MFRSLALVLAACTPTDPKPVPLDSTTTPTQTQTTTPSTTTPSTATTDTSTTPVSTGPTLAFTMGPNPVTAGDYVVIDLTLTDFTLVDPTSFPPPAPTEGEGHFHVWVDGALAGADWETEVELDTVGLEPGDHAIEITLEDSGHNELDPPVEASDTLTVN